MFDARIFNSDLEKAREILKRENAVFKGEYVLRDIIYRSKDGEPLEKTFLRLRLVSKNIWDQKSVLVAIKQTKVKEIGKESIIPIQKEFDTKEEAQKFIAENYLDKFEYDFEFERTGWQYFIGEDGVDLEEGEGYSTIEFKSSTEGGLKNLLELFDARDPIRGPSVVKIREILEEKKMLK